MFFLANQVIDKDSVIAAKISSHPMVQRVTGNNPQVSYWFDVLIKFGMKVLAAIIIFIVGKFVINFLLRLLNKFMERRRVDKAVKGFVTSVLNILLLILLFLAVISKLGIEVVSFTALLASMGVAIGMALSSDLKNFSGGIVLLVTKPIRVGDFIQSNGEMGTVEEIRIFHTILRTPDNKKLYLPNALVSGGAITNFSIESTRRVEWTFGVCYNTDVNVVRSILMDLINNDARILKEPQPMITLNTLNSSSVDILVRVWCNSSDYWDLYWDFNKIVYETFNERGISFPFPTMTIVK